jgi:hypothetical protein
VEPIPLEVGAAFVVFVLTLGNIGNDGLGEAALSGITYGGRSIVKGVGAISLSPSGETLAGVSVTADGGVFEFCELLVCPEFADGGLDEFA